MMSRMKKTHCDFFYNISKIPIKRQMGNPWLAFLSAFRKKNPSLSMKQAMKQGAIKYRSQKGSKGVKKKGKKKSKK